MMAQYGENTSSTEVGTALFYNKNGEVKLVVNKNQAW
jgi:hypothetical protein